MYRLQALFSKVQGGSRKSTYECKTAEQVVESIAEVLSLKGVVISIDKKHEMGTTPNGLGTMYEYRKIVT